CSSAGNEGDNGYVSAYRNLSDKAVRAAGGHGNLILNVTDKNAPNYLDPALTAGGWFNWNPNGGFEPSTAVAATVLVPGNTYGLFLQWDDAFDQSHGITASYNILVFDAQGNYHPELSGTSDAFSIQEAYQQTGTLTLGTTYQIAITRGNKKDPLAPLPPTTPHLSIQTFLDGIGNLTGKYFHASPLNVQTTYGHPAANGAIGCAAYVYDWTDLKTYIPVIEYYTSPGPVWIYFDENGNRLATPELRAKPEVAGVDGIGTTFFGGPYEHDQFAFFGTSAAAPHVAGVAALLIQIAGGPGSIDPGTVKQLLEATTPPRNLLPLVSTGIGASKSGFVTVTGRGSVTDGSNYLTLTYIGPPGQYIQSLTIDGSKGDLIFDTKAGNPAPTVGTIVGMFKPTDVMFTGNSTGSVLTVSFPKGKFVPGDSVSFTIDQDVAATKVSGGQADYLSYGTTYKVLFGPKVDSVSGPFQFGNGANSNIGTGYDRADGFGLVDALAAADLLQQLLSGQPQSQPAKSTPPSTHPVPLGPVAN
ncbi:MAG: S8 family serine peptidase, partial [Verrucomicrobia bacterium]|nr:S8 family serine peptidase [Verrucomicrobiota bacterium]